MPDTAEFTPMSKEKLTKSLLSTDPGEKIPVMTMLKAAAKHNGLRNIQAYMSKKAEEKADLIWEYQQEVNPYAPGEEPSEDEEAEEKVEVKPATKGRRTVKRRRKKNSEAAADEGQAVAHASNGSSSPADTLPTQTDLGPVLADLSTLREMLSAQDDRIETLSTALENIVGRLSSLNKWVMETHCVLRIFALSHEGTYENLSDPSIVEELYGHSAFDEESEGND